MAKEFRKIDNTYIKGGGSGTNDYNQLVNLPYINNVILRGNLSLADLGIIIPDMSNYYDKTEINVFIASTSEYLELLNNNKLNKDSYATDYVGGIFKTNTSQSIYLDENGVLQVGGRLGQFPNGGLYYPTTIEPSNISKNSFLISEATNTSVDNNRIFALAGGANVNLKGTHEANSTLYQVSNTFANRFTCASFRGGWMTIDQASASSLCVKVKKVYYANTPDVDLVPYSGPTESNNNIIIETETSANPVASTSKLRGYGTMTFDSALHIGQSIGTGGISGKGKLVQVGQSQCALDGNSIMVGNSIFSSKNRVALFGANHINHVQGAFMCGEGHDSTNGTFIGMGAIGKYSDISSDTAFVIGNGSSNTSRNNIFEIKDDGRVKSSATPIDNDDLTNKEYVDSVAGGNIPFVEFNHSDFTYEQVLDPDTQEVINECVPYSTTTGNANQPRAFKYGRVVNLSGAFKNINARPDNSPFIMGKVPEGCEPLATQYVLVQGSNQYKFMLTITTDGTITCGRYSTGASATIVGNNAWLNINATYISAN